MIAHTRTTASRSLSTYNSGQPYRAARGRYAPRSRVEDQLQSSAPVVEGRPTAGEFLRKIVRELRIRFYQPQTIKNYRNALRSFLRWYGGPPHRVTREDVREFLLYLVDAGAGSSWVSTHLSATRCVIAKLRRDLPPRVGRRSFPWCSASRKSSDCSKLHQRCGISCCSG